MVYDIYHVELLLTANLVKKRLKCVSKERVYVGAEAYLETTRALVFFGSLISVTTRCEDPGHTHMNVAAGTVGRRTLKWCREVSRP